MRQKAKGRRQKSWPGWLAVVTLWLLVLGGGAAIDGWMQRAEAARLIQHSQIEPYELDDLDDVSTSGPGAPEDQYRLVWDNGTASYILAAPAAGGSSPLTTKGDLYTYSTADARLGVGTNGYTLFADSAETTGLRWGSFDHGGLAGLADDDHTQYHNDSRGDARYFTETELGLTTTPGGASLIGVYDSAGNFTATTVEAVLAEIHGAKMTDWDIDAEPGAGGPATISDSDTVTFVGGEGIDTGLSAVTKTLTITAEDASTSNKGILETATDAEATAASATATALVPANLLAEIPQRAVTQAITGTDSVGDTTGAVQVTAAFAGFTITLPSLSGNTGQMLFFRRTDANPATVTISGAGTDQIDGAGSPGTVTLSSAKPKLILIGFASSWWVIFTG
jgi:hypothetical protein